MKFDFWDVEDAKYSQRTQLHPLHPKNQIN